MKKRDSSFTLIELIITIVIIGILVTIAIPQFTNTVERERGNATANNIRMIIAAEKIYRLKNGTYYTVGAPWFVPVDNINTNLNINIIENYFGHEITYNPGFYIDDVNYPGQLKIWGYRRSSTYAGEVIETFLTTSDGTYTWGGSWFAGSPPDPPNFPLPTE